VLGQVFRDAAADLGVLWALLPRDPVALAGELLSLLDADEYGVTDRLLETAGPALGPEGRAELRRLLQARLARPPGPRGRDDYDDNRGRFITSLRLRQLADLEGVDAFIAAVEAGGRAENFADEIAQRLTTSGRPGEALAWLDRAQGQHQNRHGGGPRLHIDLRIAALEALRRTPEAQALRWAAFEQELSATHLRAYLRGLADFADVEAEDQAIAHALVHPDRELALTFLASWPNLAAANRLVRAHTPNSMPATTVGSARQPRRLPRNTPLRRPCCIAPWPRTCCAGRPPVSTSMPPATCAPAPALLPYCRQRTG
jgi:hypothetical protein